MSENLVLTPAHGALDIATIKAWLDARPDTFEDPHGTGLYAIAGRSDSADLHYQARLSDASGFPRTVLVTLGPSEVRLDQEMGNAEAQRSAMDFLRWMVETFDVHVRVDGYPDAPIDDLRKGGVESRYSAKVRNLPLAWASSPREIGFFRDLDHGRDTSVSLDEARRDQPGPDEERVIAYLRSGRVDQNSDAVARDMLAFDEHHEHPVIGPADVMTDGVYQWPADLPHYVERYHVRLPRHFLAHARARGWTVSS